MNQQTEPESWIPANWEAPPGIKAGISTRTGGYSHAPYSGFNLALHVGDSESDVRRNREQLKSFLSLTREPVWLNQVHKSRIINSGFEKKNVADGIVTEVPQLPCVILTADCVPLLMCNSTGKKIGAIHVGWRGLVAGIVNNAISWFDSSPEEIIIWIGPHIRDENYEVGQDVYDACVNLDNDLQSGFTKKGRDHWYANLEMMIKTILNKQGIYRIFTTPFCTYKDDDLFFSYRREGVTGRMASMIWMNE